MGYTVPAYTYTHPSVFHTYGKREAEPYTIGQVAAGLTAGGKIESISFGHGTVPVPVKEVKTVVPSTVYAAPHAAVGIPYAYAHPLTTGVVHTYGNSLVWA